jgi:hypothetical protein
MSKRLFYNTISGAELKERWMEYGKISIMDWRENVVRRTIVV